MEVLGIDIGGSGIKGAIVNTEKGMLSSERHRIATPKPAGPAEIATAVKDLVMHFNWKGPVGCGFPSIVVNGEARSAANIDSSWNGTNVQQVFEQKTGNSFHILNDADAAALAEMKFGAGKGKKGLVFVITIGTGLGSGVFYNGMLIPNFELGHLFTKNGKVYEKFAADSARKREKLDFPTWGKRVNNYLTHLLRLFSPDLFIIGGGVSKKFDLYKQQLKIQVPVVAAQTQNHAGIIGAAIAAAKI